MKAIKLKIHGRVQGVFFRQYTKQQALQFGVLGTVRNCKDGTVEIEAEAENTMLEGFIASCKKGPDASRVTQVDMHEVPLKNFKKFEIIR